MSMLVILGVLFVGSRAPAAPVNVVNYGAVPNDNRDDAAAINAAIATARAGYTVYLPPGVYLITTYIAPKSDIHVVGSTQEETILKYIGTANQPMIRMVKVSNVEISHLTLDGNHDPNAVQGITASSGSGLYLHHLTIRNFVETGVLGPHGIYCSSAITDSSICDNTITSIAPGTEWGAGMRLSYGSSRNQILRNTISDTGRGGILCDSDSTDLVIRDNVVSLSGGLGLGIELWGGCDRALVEDNVIDHWLSVSGRGSAIRRNRISDKSGIHKTWGIEYGGGALDGILTGNGQYITLDENEIRNNGRVGIQLTGAAGIDQLSFVNNFITGNGGASITGDRGDDLEWENNTVSGNATNTQLHSRGFANRKPTASFTCPAAVRVGEEVRFTNTSSDPDGTIGHVLWDFGDGLPSTGTSPVHAYSGPGSYRVSLVVWDNPGRGAHAERTVLVASSSDLNLDGRVDYLDFAAFARQWRARIAAGQAAEADLDHSGRVDFGDLARFLQDWSHAPEP